MHSFYEWADCLHGRSALPLARLSETGVRTPPRAGGRRKGEPVTQVVGGYLETAYAPPTLGLRRDTRSSILVPLAAQSVSRCSLQWTSKVSFLCQLTEHEQDEADDNTHVYDARSRK